MATQRFTPGPLVRCLCETVSGDHPAVDTPSTALPRHASTEAVEAVLTEALYWVITKIRSDARGQPDDIVRAAELLVDPEPDRTYSDISIPETSK